ncbi:hypothetical protein EMIHUDRAFT_208526 [Emiliania huxleyi CCMP1516]|uniref:Uncharacterized protein n=2 Tax=Emiliania huxleyi TaxID=2903 RepID=A0A0D3JAQ2_EMIH1|nr:hypothetical protein EMIHUDRAFT_208526 [Emiliania huxleyi CCMP1516]EOD20587.1 hypothetical protein EMIHUDRAFT_208526 [Emiliania huxleyi CCMP1516]|eukprot:XP_005773016.1 hypothetical protein EMIHUDRAFT_208526 [Emiliania huxleyi CCMP1516]
MTKRGQQQRGKGRSASGRANAGPRLVDKNALSARGGGPSRQSRSPSPDSPPAKRASSADSSGYDTDLPDEVQQEAVRRVCGALGLKEQYDAAVAAGELLELLESLPRGTVEASIRLMRGYTRTGENEGWRPKGQKGKTDNGRPRKLSDITIHGITDHLTKRITRKIKPNCMRNWKRVFSSFGTPLSNDAEERQWRKYVL